MTTPQPHWSYGTLPSVAGVLADTTDGLTGREIGDVLQRLRMEDTNPDGEQARSAHGGLRRARQNKDRSSSRIITFIVAAMAPVRYRNQLDLFALRQDRLNEHLAFVGLRVNDEGRVAKGAVARTLDESVSRGHVDPR